MYLHVQVDGGEGQAAEEGEHHGRRQERRLEDQLSRWIHIDETFSKENGTSRL